jgi:hypothetical protein
MRTGAIERDVHLGGASMRKLSILLFLTVISCSSQQQSPAPVPRTTAAAAAEVPPPAVVAPPVPVVEEGLRPNENLIFGHNYKFALVTPVGMMTDPELARNLRIDAVFYPPEGSWNDAVALTTRVMQKTATVGFAEIVAQDEAQYKTSTPAVEISEQAPIPLPEGASVRVRYFRDDFHSLHEAVAYLDRPKTVILIVLRGNSDEEFKKGLPLLDTLVRSYRNLDVSSAGGAH